MFTCPGVAYTSECFPCRPGWFSPVPGSSSCQPCPSNSFSIKGASSCTRCPEHYYSRMRSVFLINCHQLSCFYIQSPRLLIFAVCLTSLSDEGWAECKVRPPCSEKDYFQIHTACDSEGKVSDVHTSHISHTHTSTVSPGQRQTRPSYPAGQLKANIQKRCNRSF